MRRVKKQKSTKHFKLIGGLLGIGCLLALGFSPYGRAVGNAVMGAYQTVAGKAHLVLGQVVIEGHARTQLATLNRALHLEQGMPLFDIDLADVHNSVGSLPWVKSVVVERHLPSTLFIRIEEKEPIAVWQNNKKYFPLDTDGHPIEDQTTALADLILIVGQDAPAHTPRLIETLKKYPDIYARVRSAVRREGRRWDLILNDVSDGLEINLPETDIDRALHYLQVTDETEKLLKRDLKRINLLHPDRLIVRPKGDPKK